MGLLRAVVIHTHADGEVNDNTTDTWHFGSPPQLSTPTIRAAITDALQDFYEVQVEGVGGPISSFMSRTISRTVGRTIKFYEKDVGVKNFGSPIAVEDGLPIGAASSSDNLPSEVQLCLSFHGDLTNVPEQVGNTRPAAQRRGRISLGPWTESANEGAGETRGHPSTTLRALLSGAAARLLAASQSDPDWSWVVAHAASTAAWSSVPVVGGWTDDAWDTQRRSGEDAINKTFFP